MSRQCEICGKKPQFGNNISHSNNVTKRRWNPNLQNVRAFVGLTVKQLRVCTSCIQAGKVTKAPRGLNKASQAAAVAKAAAAKTAAKTA